jgi:hypothetical protein
LNLSFFFHLLVVCPFVGVAVVTNHSLTPRNITTVWDVFALNSQSDSLTLENWSSFCLALDKEIAKTPSQSSSKKKEAAVVSRSAMGKRSSSSITAATPDTTTTHSLESSTGQTNVSKKIRRDRSPPDMQLEQIVSGNVTHSPQKNSIDSGDDSLSLALVTPPKSTATAASCQLSFVS